MRAREILVSRLPLPHGVVVTHKILVLVSQVRILLGQQGKRFLKLIVNLKERINMVKKSTTFTSKDIIKLRDELTSTKTRYWRIIRTENVMSKKAKNAGIGSGFDLAALYNRILQMTDQLIKIKLMLQFINNSESGSDMKFDYETAKKTHYYNIFKACELKEQLSHWEEILKKSTINPATKAKAGVKGTGKIEVFSSAKIASIKKNLQLEINKIDATIAEFNDNTVITVDDEDITKLLTT